jgi:putative transposase
MRDDLQTDLVLDALGMAVTARGAACAGVVDHSDPGQFTSPRDGLYANQSQIELSMGSVGDPWGNAIAETLFASLENELLRRERVDTCEHARIRNRSRSTPTPNREA